MSIVLLTLLANIIILIAFKLFPKFKVINLNAIIVNYFIAVLTGVFILGKLPFDSSVLKASWLPYALFLGLNFVSIFTLVALTIQKTGVAIGSLFQKMSLLFPVLAAILFFGEEVTSSRLVGVGLAILSIVIINLPSKDSSEVDNLKRFWYLPLLTLLGSGLIELILFYVDMKGIVPNGDISFVCFIFFTAGSIGLLYKFVRRDFKFQRQDVIAGICLGVPNFFSIYLLLLALSKGTDASLLFPILNVGTIVAGVLLAYFVFKEKMNFFKVLGIGISILGIYLIVA